MIPIPTQYRSLKHLQLITWKEIFDTWRQNEAQQGSWRTFWADRGFDSWDEWRTAYAAPLHPEGLAWHLYQITDPIQDAPLLFGTPTKGWIEKAYGGEIAKQLRDIRQLPIVTENDKVAAIRESFPQETMLAGLVT